MAFFPIFWRAMVAIVGGASLILAIEGLKTGVSRRRWGKGYGRHDQPGLFWATTAARFAAFGIAVVLLLFGPHLIRGLT